MVSVSLPSSRVYVLSIVFFFVFQVTLIPICALAYWLKRVPAALVALGVATAVVGLTLPSIVTDFVIAQGLGSPVDCVLGRFAISGFIAVVALRIFGASVGTTPKGADADLATWIAFVTSAADVTFDAEGKRIPAPSGAIFALVRVLLLRLVGLSVVSSISEPFGGYPVTTLCGNPAWGTPLAAFAGWIDHVFVQLAIIWLFLTMLIDVGSLPLLAQGYTPMKCFDNPIFTSTSVRLFWGKKWNQLVSVSFRRSVFVPLSKLGVPPTYGALITFAASGLYHEYQFVVGFPEYRFGGITRFFVVHGVLCGLDAMFSKTLGKKYLASVPWQIKNLAVGIMLSPTVPMFASFWFDAGFFPAVARMGVLVSVS